LLRPYEYRLLRNGFGWQITPQNQGGDRKLFQPTPTGRLRPAEF
jgi:hypothetical protein